METRDLPLSGDAISGHLHKATTSLHSLLIVYANDGFDSLAADELQSTLLQLVSNVTSAFRLFTQHQKQHEALSRQAADAIETITRLSPLIKEQQDQIKSLRDELESSKSIEVAQSRSTCSVSTATDLNVSAMEEQILVCTCFQFDDFRLLHA